MSRNLGTESVTLTKTRRTWRVNIETPLGGEYVLTAQRENVSQNGAEIVAKIPAGVVTRSLSAAANDFVTLAEGKTISGAELAQAVAGFIEQWEAADEAADEASAAPSL